MWAFSGGLREDRAALLAANGFAALAIAYCYYEDLPEQYGLFQLSYFESAIDWLISQPKVKSGGVGLVGLSNGGTLALALAAQLGHKVKAVVSVSGYPIFIGCSLATPSMTMPGRLPIRILRATLVIYNSCLYLKAKNFTHQGHHGRFRWSKYPALFYLFMASMMYLFPM